MTGILNDLHVLGIMLDASAGLVIVALHGLLLAFFAKLMGDPGPAQDGRMTINPLQHIDFFSLLGFIFAQLGWIKPMDIRSRDIRGGILGIVAVVLAAIAATWAVGRGLMAMRGVLVSVTPSDFLQTMNSWTYTYARLSDRFALFNMLPVLSLTAAHAVREYLPGILRQTGAVTSALTLVLALVLKIWFWR